MLWYGMVWYDLVWQCMVRNYMVVVWYRSVVWYGVVWRSTKISIAGYGNMKKITYTSKYDIKALTRARRRTHSREASVYDELSAPYGIFPAPSAIWPLASRQKACFRVVPSGAFPSASGSRSAGAVVMGIWEGRA